MYAPTDQRSSHAARAFCYSWLRQLLLDPRGLVGVLFLGLRHQRMCLRCLNLKPIRLLLCPPWNGCGIVSTVVAIGGVCQYVFSTLRSTRVPTLRKSALHCTALPGAPYCERLVALGSLRWFRECSEEYQRNGNVSRAEFQYAPPHGRMLQYPTRAAQSAHGVESLCSARAHRPQCRRADGACG